MLLEVLFLAFTGTVDNYYVLAWDLTSARRCHCLRLPDYRYYCDRGYGLEWEIVPSYKVHGSREDAVNALRQRREAEIERLQRSKERIYEVEDTPI